MRTGALRFLVVDNARRQAHLHSAQFCAVGEILTLTLANRLDEDGTYS
jgi:hypothetical protein